MKIDILIKPGQDPSQMENVFKVAANLAGIPLQINRTSNFAAFSNCSVNPAMTPIVIINGQVEFAGGLPNVDLVKKRLIELRT